MRVRFSSLGFILAVGVVVELIVFILVVKAIGLGWALLALLAASIGGAWLLKREGTRAWRRFREVTAAGGRPGPHLSRALVGLVAAVLLILPGFVSDVIGLALLIPPIRAVAGRATVALATRRLSSSVAGDLFGPRRVRVKVGRTVRAPADTPPTWTDAAAPIEGEVVDRR
jgi:UPF0716 protein FxsA